VHRRRDKVQHVALAAVARVLNMVRRPGEQTGRQGAQSRSRGLAAAARVLNMGLETGKASVRRRDQVQQVALAAEVLPGSKYGPGTRGADTQTRKQGGSG